jgi:hypothetical protein
MQEKEKFKYSKLNLSHFAHSSVADGGARLLG